MIKTIDRYLLTRFILSLFLAVGAIMLVALVVDLVENLEEIVDNAASTKEVIKYYIYFLPWIYKITIPAAVLLAGLFSIGLLARNNEIMAMKSAGVSLYRIAWPLLVFTFFLSLGNIYFNEEILPLATKERNRIKHGTVDPKRDRRSSVLYNLSKQGEGGYIYHFEIFRPKRGEAKNCLVQRFENDSLRESYRGERMRYDQGFWIIYDGAKRDFTNSAETFIQFDSLILKNCREKPEEFEKYRGKPEDMGYRELAGYIQVLKKTGATYTRETVDLKIKLSFPFTSFIVMFICIPLASNPKRSGVAMSFAIASGVSLLYFVVFKVTQSLGYSGKLPPDLAAWSINIVFFIIGLFVILRSHK
ncbi:MAG: YjgP/YjgQ family permease [FCB group bacterium]|nr:YjgP/YjgQ family permease [FCB group bacterium]